MNGHGDRAIRRGGRKTRRGSSWPSFSIRKKQAGIVEKLTFHLGSHIIDTAGQGASARARITARDLTVTDDRSIGLPAKLALKRLAHWVLHYLEGVAASSVTRCGFDNTKSLAIDAIGAGNCNERTVRIYRGDRSEGEEDGREDGGLGEHFRNSKNDENVKDSR